MIDKVITRIVQRWINGHIISEQDGDVYRYGLDLLISTCGNLLAILVTAAVVGCFGETVLFLAVVIPLQCFGGGYHADTHWRCFLIMYTCWWLMIPNLPQLSLLVLVLVAMGAGVVIWVLAPVPNTNVAMSAAHRRKMKFIARVFCAISVLGGILFSSVSRDYGRYVVVGVAAIAFSMACAAVKNRYVNNASSM